MNTELMPGLTNVVRFPVEERTAPSMDVIYKIEPDVREVMQVVEGFFLEMPDPELANQVDAETACYIAEQVLPLAPPERGPALDGLLLPVVATAIEACHRADQVGKRAVAAGERLADGPSGRGPMAGPAGAGRGRAAEPVGGAAGPGAPAVPGGARSQPSSWDGTARRDLDALQCGGHLGLACRSGADRPGAQGRTHRPNRKGRLPMQAALLVL